MRKTSVIVSAIIYVTKDTQTSDSNSLEVTITYLLAPGAHTPTSTQSDMHQKSPCSGGLPTAFILHFRLRWAWFNKKKTKVTTNDVRDLVWANRANLLHIKQSADLSLRSSLLWCHMNIHLLPRFGRLHQGWVLLRKRSAVEFRINLSMPRESSRARREGGKVKAQSKIISKWHLEMIYCLFMN